jgi:predicted RNase H-like HicB family nuclease
MKNQFVVCINNSNYPASYNVAEVPALPGCLSQGKTFEEAKENAKRRLRVG